MNETEKIERQRILSDQGAFERRIMSRTPHDVWDDTAVLECGHKCLVPQSTLRQPPLLGAVPLPKLR